jgi:hypothetical protein
LQLRLSLTRTRNLLTNRIIANNPKCITITEFFRAPTKGSKRYRRYFEKYGTTPVDIRNARSVTTLFNLVQLPVPDSTILKTCITLWNLSFFGNSFREFSFKCWNNYLALNNRVAAFDNTVNPNCTFCRIRDPNTSTRESFNHIFFSCPSVSVIIDYLLEFFLIGNMNLEEKKSFFWTGYVDRQENLQHLYLIFWESARFSIYRYKKRRSIPNPLMVKNDIFFNLKTSIYSKPGYRTYIDSCPALARWLPALG